MTEPDASVLPNFNLWRDPWIRATRPDGSAVELGIGDCLAGAHTLYALHDPSPLVVAGTHRLLVAILQAIYAPESLDEIEMLLEAGAFDPARLELFASRYSERFELFHPTAPFLQSGDVALDAWRKPAKGDSQHTSSVEPKPVAYLFTEVPTDTYRTLFNHVTDDSHQVCPACCARGLITLPAFAIGLGSGNRSSINGAPPIYMVPAGATLFQSLALSLTTPDYQPETASEERAAIAPWNWNPVIAKGQELSAVGYLESLTFPVRRVRLFPEAGSVRCTQCGIATGIHVRTMLFTMGHWWGSSGSAWNDPFVAFRAPGGRVKGEPGGLLPVRPQPGKALWREYIGLLLAERDTQLRPKIVRQIGRLIDREALPAHQTVRFRCIGLSTNKAKIEEWFDEALDAPPTLLTDPDGALVVDDALRRAGETEYLLTQTFNKYFRPERTSSNPAEKTARFKTLRARMQTEFWQRLALDFHAFIFDVSNLARRAQAEHHWGDQLVRVGADVFESTADQIGERADALRARVIAQAECRRRLAAKRKEWFGE